MFSLCITSFPGWVIYSHCWNKYFVNFFLLEERSSSNSSLPPGKNVQSQFFKRSDLHQTLNIDRNLLILPLGGCLASQSLVCKVIFYTYGTKFLTWTLEKAPKNLFWVLTWHFQLTWWMPLFAVFIFLPQLNQSQCLLCSSLFIPQHSAALIGSAPSVQTHSGKVPSLKSFSHRC